MSSMGSLGLFSDYPESTPSARHMCAITSKASYGFADVLLCIIMTDLNFEANLCSRLHTE